MKRLLPTLVILVILAALVLQNVQPAQAEERAAPPASSLRSAATSVASLKPIADTWIRDSLPTTNYGSNALFVVGEDNGSAQVNRGLLKFDLSYLSAVNATITGANLTLTVGNYDYSNNARTLRAYQLRRAWGESTATWNDYATSNAWGIAGAGSTSTDRYSTELGSGSVGANPSVGSTVTLTLSVSQIQDWVNGTVTNNGLLLQVDAESNDLIGYYSSENSATFPLLIISYTTDSAQMTAMADTSILSSAPTTNYGSNTSIFVGEDNVSASVRRGLLKFDLSWLSHVDGTVTGATLILTLAADSADNTRTFRAYQIRRAWTEIEATWNKYDTGGSWATAGAGSTASDRYVTEVGSAAIAGDAPLDTTIVINLTASMIQDWVDGDITNNGLIIQADTENADLWSFYSSETETAHWNILPTLIIDYAANIGSFVEGGSISSGSITASNGAGSTISGLTMGDWYGIETSGGPWNSGSGSEYDIALSNDAGATWVMSETGNWISHVENNGSYERIFFKATTTSIKVRAEDYYFADNNGTIDYTLYDSTISQNLPVWQIGNYLVDGSAESWPYLNFPPYFPWSVSSLFDVTRQTTWTYGGDTAPMCNQNFAMLRASLNSPSYIEQEFMFDGGDMFITLGLRTQGSAQMIVQLKDPFDQWHVVESFITNGASNWKAFNYLRADQWLGKYTLRITAFSMGAQSFAAVDGLSVGEGWYQPCTYNGTVLTPPGAMPGTLVQKTSPIITDDTGNLISNSDLALTGSEITDWSVVDTSYQHVPLSGSSGYLALFVGAPPVWTKPWIQTMYELPVADTLPEFLGFTAADAFSVVARQFSISLFMMKIADDMHRIPLEIVNVDTGQRYDSFDFSSHNIFDSFQDPSVPQGWDEHLITVDVPPGRYRLVFGNSWPLPAMPETTLYIDKVCVGGYGFIIAPDCEFTSEELFLINSNANLQNEQQAAAQATTIAGLTGTPVAATAFAAQTQVVGTQVAAAQATQTALVAAGNQTQIALATSAQASALTATPRAALTGTAFVQQFRATLTQIAGATQTRAAQIAINNATAVALKTQQAALQQTAWANATQSGQLTAQANYQATLNAQATAAVEYQPTVQIIQTNAAATQAAAATALATNSNATTQSQATAAVDYQATINAIATQQAQAQATIIALLTAAPNTNATLQYQATQIAQDYATLIATYQALATQQVLEVPIVQPMPEDALITADVDCTRPTNAINIPAWIDYEVCRILWFFTPNQYNMNQISSALDPLQNYEPFGSLIEINGMREDLLTEWQKYDWYTTGLEGSQDSLPVIAESDYATPPPGDVFTFMQRATEVPLLYGNLDFNDPALNYVFSTTCTLRIADLIGPYITPPICFLVDIFRTHGYLPIARLILDLGAFLLFIGYVNNTIQELLGEAKQVERVIQNQGRRSGG